MAAADPKIISKAEYKMHLRRLVLAIVREHGSLSVMAVTELANSLIVRHDIQEAVRRAEAGDD